MKYCFYIIAILVSSAVFSQKEIRIQNQSGESISIETTRILRILLDNDTLWACKNFRIKGDTLQFESKYTIDDKTFTMKPVEKDFYTVDPYAQDTVIRVPMNKVKMLECTKKSLEKYYYYRYFNMHRIEPLLLAFLIGGGIAGGLSTMVIQGVSATNMAVCGIAVSLLAWRVIKVRVICGTRKYYLNEWSVYTTDSGGEKKK